MNCSTRLRTEHSPGNNFHIIAINLDFNYIREAMMKYKEEK
jgi:hypothetical protein